MTRREARHTEAAEVLEPQDLREVIGANISAERARLGLTIEELARKVGISVRLIQKHMAGDNAPGHANLLRYSRVFGRPVAWFFDRHDAEAAA